ncbi:MAG: DUF2778 domain-containing protein [Pseudomonadota bacterium]|nr:DUF2778 domain-containing protein [Pseudomonadota bacterium]
MAFLRRGIGDSDSDINSGGLWREIFSAVRWVAIPCVAVFFAAWSMAALASLHSAAEHTSAGSFARASLPIQPQLSQTPRREQVAKAAVMPVEKSARLALRTKSKAPAVRTPADPFGKVIAEAKLSRQKLHAAFARAGMVVEVTKTPETVEVAMAMPNPDRFHRGAAETAPADGKAATAAAPHQLALATLGRIGFGAELAYATATASPDNPVQLALASLPLDPYGVGGDEPETGEVRMPDAVDLPPTRPETRTASRSRPKPADAATARKPVQADDDQQPQQELAYARPDKPAVDAFKGLFGTPKAGKGVAIYDISAAVVHMPDGTKLEAHSGIGKMADNPRYVHVRNKGPTPPNTYKLTMREKLFHGVEAIRMTPIGDQTMHGRDGMLAHSYLLRGRREQSHGCVAFANYPKFLKAFKQGKVTHMIVVPSMSKLPKVQMVSNRGRGA